MRGKATVLTTLFTRVDDTMKGSTIIQDALKRPGPAPRLSDSEVQLLLGDGAYNDAALESYLEQYRSLLLLAPAKANQAPKRSPSAQKQLNRLRFICETVNAQLQEPWHLSKHSAKSTLMTRIAAKVTAHRVGIMVNTLLDRPALRLADLAV